MKQTVQHSKDLAFALNIAEQAGEIALMHYNQGIRATMKPDNTPVTAADQECERLIRQSIAKNFPDDGILGEEEAEKTSLAGNRRRWILDPIDGTYNYARQVPIWSMLLALEENGEVTVGVLHAPAMGETFWAERGGGTWRNGERVHVSDISSLRESMFTFGAPNRIVAEGYWQGLERAVIATYRQRGFGDYINFAHVLEGKAEAAFEVGLKPWDIAPMKILVEEAGGRFSDLHGGSSIHHGSCLVSNGHIHDELLNLLVGPR